MPLVLPSTPASLPYAAPTLSDALVRLRQDIFDQAGPSPRWADGDLTRAIDRALDQYSFVMPWVQTALVPALGGCRLIPVPVALDSGGVVGGASSGPAWWVESAEYPMGQFPHQMVPFLEMPQPLISPPAGLVATLAGLGPLSGTYSYVATFLGVAGESAVSVPTAVVTPAAGAVQVTMPLGPEPYCQGRNLYRTGAGGVLPYRLVSAIADNATTVFLDKVADGALGVAAPTGDSTQGQPLAELQLSSVELPDPLLPGTVLLTFASKHLLGAGGTTVPEQHHDLVLLGAGAYACLAYQVGTNDLFDYQDGVMRDQVHEAKTPEHWLSVGNNLLALFKTRLEEVKHQRDAASAAVAQWGGVARRWGWV